jgi:tetratricopeptide (TPR) repeat protein
MKKNVWQGVLVAMAFVLPLGALAQGKPPIMQPPFAKGPKLTTEQALKEAPKTDPSLKDLDKAFKDAEGKLKKKPKDAKLKKAYVEACYKYGHQAMLNGNKSPKVLYRAALALFRRGLKVDPKHQPSLDDKKTIEDIYQSMPGGVPK